MMLSILTATFNRADLIGNLYESLKKQTCKDFEWIVVDDGSLDSTKEIIREYQKLNEISIKYVYKENGGKHSAINIAIEQASKDFCILIDSDDYLLVDSVEKIHKKINAHENINGNFIGYCFRCVLEDGSFLGSDFSNKYYLPKELVSTPTEVMRLALGDMAYVFKTSKLKQVKFPIIYGERFFPELYIWNQLSDVGRIKYFLHIPVCVVNYQADGLSSDFIKLLKGSPIAFYIYYIDMIKREKRIFQKIKYIVRVFQSIYFRLKK
ncbi:glycosyltransferase family 2 protein [Vibrio vulnificus]|uniref:glycosyltransferase family 2 protein n=2 Tax=Vibrio vulnificus TaxID=672 RepID=UPI000D3E683B|nr:glycosyltransferase family 2 protein [Vibrio vulnificus]MBN8149934.1 glycosyltransferase family 2 protein [Vibrio vulnificus]PUZ80429.1 glycosyltransferase family 2 protein [Vibrio vulnificus]